MHDWVFSKAYNEGYTPQQRWHKMMDNLYTIHQKHFDGCIMGNTILEAANTSPALLKPIQEYFEDAKAALTHLLKKHYSVEESERLSTQYFREYQGGLMLMRLYQEPQQLLEVLEKLKLEFPNLQNQD